MELKELPFKMPSLDLTGKVAIVTGGATGFGYAMAISLAYCGANVVVASRRKETCEKVAEEIRNMGKKAISIATDIKIKNQVDNLIEKTIQEFGKIDIMINNAGVGITKKAIDITEEEWDNVLDTNLKGVFFGATAAAKEMIRQGNGGRIINISSTGGLKGAKGISPYCASKAGVINLTKALAVEWGKYNITVNAICPGYVVTEINRDNMENPKVRDKLIEKTALKRLGQVEEIASVATFLASDCSSLITGEYIVADAGSVAG